jgi:hypothetical protein
MAGAAVCVFWILAVSARAGSVEVLGTARARGVVVLRVVLDSLDASDQISIEIAPAGRQPTAVNVLKDNDPNIPQSIFGLMPDGSAVAYLPLCASFDGDRAVGIFDSPGAYRIHVRHAIRSGTEAREAVASCEVVIGAPLEADAALLDEPLSSEIESALQLPKPTRGTGRTLQDVVGLVVANVTMRPDRPVQREWGDALRELALRHEESSYAPYLAYGAGSALAGRVVTEHREMQVPDAQIQGVEEYQRSQQMLALVTERGDAYLRPLAEWYRAGTRAWVGDVDGASTSVAQMKSQYGDRPYLRPLFAQLEKQLPELKARQEARGNPSPGGGP